MAEKTPTRSDNEHRDPPTRTGTAPDGPRPSRSPPGDRQTTSTTGDPSATDHRADAQHGESSAEDTTGEQPPSPVDDDVAVEEEQLGEEELLAEEEQIAEEEPPPPQATKPPKRRNAVKRAMEYDLKDMYPEVNILIERNRRKWDFRDPDIIRAIWVEAKTNALAEWKVRHAIVAKRKKPAMEVQYNTTTELRKKFLQDQRERERKEREQNKRIHRTELPEFDEVKLATNIATQIRYDYNRNNPPVPYYIVTHYHKYKRPPFTTFGLDKKGCKPP